MSDCSTQAMMPKERRTCGTCKHVSNVWLDCMFAASDSRYYMRCTRPDMRACEHYVDDPDSLPRRYERLAQVAREMLDEYRLLYDKHATIAGKVGTFARFEAPGVFAGQLEALGVSVDD